MAASPVKGSHVGGFELNLRRIDTAALAMAFGAVPWDTEIFGRQVAQIAGIEVREPAGARREFQVFEDWRDRTDVAFVSCRLPHDRLPESMFLEASGFRFVELVCRPRLTGLRLLDGLAADVELVEATAADLPELETVAEDAFVTGRFRLDWRLPSTINGLGSRHWVRTSLDNPRHLVLKGMAESRLAGFFIIERTGRDRCYWHLTAVAPAFQGRGVGKRLWRSVMRHLQDQGVDVIETLISLHNTPVLNLYARLGFSFTPPDMTFHWLRGDHLDPLGLQL